MSPGTWVRAVLTPRLRHLVSIEPLPAPGGVGLPPPAGTACDQA